MLSTLGIQAGDDFSARRLCFALQGQGTRGWRCFGVSRDEARLGADTYRKSFSDVEQLQVVGPSLSSCYGSPLYQRMWGTSLLYGRLVASAMLEVK